MAVCVTMSTEVIRASDLKVGADWIAKAARGLIRAAFLGAVLATPTLAENSLTSDTLLATLQQQCSELAADPERALAASDDPNTIVAQSADKALLQVTRTIPMGTEGVVTVFFNQSIYPGGSETVCSLAVTLMGAPGQPQLPDLPDKLATAAEGLLGGPVTALGGPVTMQGQTAQLRRWTTGQGFPPPAELGYLQGPNFIGLSIRHLTPASGN